MTENGYVEGFYSLLDASDEVKFNDFKSENALLEPIAENWNVQRLQWFTKGFYKVSRVENEVVITDIRMGISGLYFFNFVVGEQRENGIAAIDAKELEMEQEFSMEPLNRLWARIWDENAELN